MSQNPNHSAASIIVQLLRDTLAQHAPFGAHIAETTKRAITDKWLDRLEEHNTSIMAPFVDMVLEQTDPPPEIKHMLQQMLRPSQAVGSFASNFLLYGIGFSIAGQIVNPFLVGLANDTNTAAVAAGISRPISPPDLATGAIRGIEPGVVSDIAAPGWATEIAARSGVSAADMQFLVDITGAPPDLTTLFEAVRRGYITEEELVTGLRQSDLRDSWIPTVSKLRYTTPTPVDMVRADVQGQLPSDQARQLAFELGLEPPGFVNDNPDWYQILYDTAGRPPGPEEVGRMANRGIVPWEGVGPDVVSFQQMIHESDLKNKWYEPLRQLQVYVPPPRLVAGLLKSGSITEQQARAIWISDGVPPALADAYVHQALVEETATDKVLSKGEITKSFVAGFINEQDALDMLNTIGYRGQVAADILKLATMQRELSAINKVVNRVGSLYVNYKITPTDAQRSLTELGLPAAQIVDLLNIWEIERVPETRIPTIAQLGAAVHYGIIDGTTAIDKAQLLGYTPLDAWIILGAEAHAPLVDANGAAIPRPPDTNTGVDV